MKTILTGLLSAFLCMATFAQKVSISFKGINQSRSYRVLVDGNNYSSDNAVNINNGNGDGAQRTITLNNLSQGSHTISIYNQPNASGNQNQSLVYSNSFVLRSDYDMYIAFNGNWISFSEKILPVSNSDMNSLNSMSDYDFNLLVQEIKRNRYQSARVASIKEAVTSTDRFTVNQLHQLLTLVTSESSRLELAKLSYNVIADTDNFSTLSTLFASQANRNDLSSFIEARMNNSTMSGNSGVNTSTRVLLSVNQYNQLLQDLNYNAYQSGKYTILKDAFVKSSNAFTTAQLRQLLTTITSEPDRLYLAKLSYITASDPANFATLLTLFSTQASRGELNSYIISNGGTGGNIYVQTKAAMDNTSFSQLLRTASNHFLPWDKVKDVREAFTDPQNNFTSEQARQLMAVVSAGNLLAVTESAKLELAKLSYARIIDPVNFSQVINLFTDQASRDELNSYVKLQVQNN